MSQNTINIDEASIRKAKWIGKLVIPFFLIVFLFASLTPFTTIPAGHVGVASLFGKVDPTELPEGFHIINPLKKIQKID